MSPKQSAMEAAQQAAIPGLRNNRWDEAIEAAILAYLSALAQDEASVEAVARGIYANWHGEKHAKKADYNRSPANTKEAFLSDARAVLRALLERAKEQQG
jgi:hypothetical protein